MDEKLPKISSLQMYAILILARIMHTMIYFTDVNEAGTGLMAALLITTLIEVLAAAPLISYIQNGGADIAADLSGDRQGKSPIAKLIRLGYAAFFLFISSGTLMYFAEFLEEEFEDIANPYIVIILLAVVSCYCARLGIEGIARSGVIILGIVLVLVVLMAAVSEGDFDTLNIEPITLSSFPGMLDYAVKDITSAWWLPMFAALAPHLRGSAKKTAAAYLISKLLILETLLLLVILMLWNFVGVIGYPILALGAYAKTDFIQHFDAINMFVWTLNCIIVNGAYIFIASDSRQKRPGSLGTAAAGLIVAVAAGISYNLGLSYQSSIATVIKLCGIIGLGIILPAAAILVKKIRSFQRKCLENSSCLP